MGARIAVVTGASRGIGRAIAQGLCRQGAQVFGVARASDTLQATAEAIKAEGGLFEPVALDLTSGFRAADLVEGAARMDALDLSLEP